MANKMNGLTRAAIGLGNTKEFLTSYEWDFEFTKCPAILGNANGNFFTGLRQRAVSVTTPEEPTNTPINVNIRGHIFSQNGLVMHNGNFSMIIQDFSDVGIQKYLMALLYDICDPKTKASRMQPNQYFFNCKLYQLNPEREVVKTWYCNDCLLVAANVTDDMTSDKNPIGQISIVFSTDDFTVEYNKDGNTSYNVTQTRTNDNTYTSGN